ncbi:MAG: hypothetical protein R2795_05405 [Saprospiraceae bacterium]
MFKMLFTGLLIYFIYRFFIAPPAIGNREDHFDDTPPKTGTKPSPSDDDYIDYEEVD